MSTEDCELTHHVIEVCKYVCLSQLCSLLFLVLAASERVGERTAIHHLSHDTWLKSYLMPTAKDSSVNVQCIYH